MKLFYGLMYVLVALAGLTVQAQPRNLVPNPDFEAYSACPSWFSMFSLADQWAAPSQGTTDYFNACATSDTVKVPINFGGYRPTHSGQGYAGFYGYYAGYREYAQVQLLEPLQAGKVYYVHFFVALSQRLNLPIDNVGAYFSIEPPISSSWHYLLSLVNQAPQIRNPPGRLLANTLEWMKIAGSFTAQGGEQYLTIGNFDPDSLTYIEQAPIFRASYYYLDDVYVSDCPLLADLGPDRVLCPGDSVVLDASSPGAHYRWQDGSLNATRLVKEPGTYWVDVTLPDCQLRDSIKISYLATSPGPLIADVKLCPGEDFTLLNAGHVGATAYVWQDGSTSPVYKAEPGSYWVDIQFAHCSFRDSVVVLPADPIASELTWYVPVCNNQPKVLDVTLKGATSYLWPDGSRLPTYTVSKTGIYSVTIQRGHCSFVWYTNVEYFDPPSFFLSPNSANAWAKHSF